MRYDQVRYLSILTYINIVTLNASATSSSTFKTSEYSDPQLCEVVRYGRLGLRQIYIYSWLSQTPNTDIETPPPPLPPPRLRSLENHKRQNTQYTIHISPQPPSLLNRLKRIVGLGLLSSCSPSTTPYHQHQHHHCWGLAS